MDPYRLPTGDFEPVGELGREGAAAGATGHGAPDSAAAPPRVDAAALGPALPPHGPLALFVTVRIKCFGSRAGVGRCAGLGGDVHASVVAPVLVAQSPSGARAVALEPLGASSVAVRTRVRPVSFR